MRIVYYSLLNFFLCTTVQITTANETSTTPAPTYTGYDQVQSSLAKQFRQDITSLRRGNPDGMTITLLSLITNNSDTNTTQRRTSNNSNNKQPILDFLTRPYIISIFAITILLLAITFILVCCCCPCLCGPLCCPIFCRDHCYNGCVSKQFDKCKIKACICCCCRPFCCNIIEISCDLFDEHFLSCFKNKHQNHSNTYILYSFGLIVYSLIMWQAVDRLVSNNHLYENIFDVSNDYSFHSELVTMVDELIDHFGNIEPLTFELIDTVFDTSDLVLTELTNNTVPLANSIVLDLQRTVKQMNKNFTNITFRTQLLHPFTFQREIGEMECTICDVIPPLIQSINESINSQAVTQVREFEDVLNETKHTNTIYKNLINQSATRFFIVLDQYIVNANNTKNLIDDSFSNYGEPYMKEYGNTVFWRTFIIPIYFFWFFLLCTPLGMFCGYRFKCDRIDIECCKDDRGCCCLFVQQIWDRICLKLNWCCALCCSSGFMLLFLAFFVLLPIILADICVELDDLESNLQNSGLGKVLSAIFENVDSTPEESDDQSFYNTTIATPTTTDAGNTNNLIYFDVLDACLYGNVSLLTIFNLQDAFDDYLLLKEEIQSAIDIDLTSYLEQFDRYFDQLDTVLTLVDNSTVTWLGDFAVTRLNEFTDGDICYCPTNPSDTSSGSAFTRQR